MKDRLKKLRKELHLTQKSFAEILGTKQNTIATYEMGRNNPSDPVIRSICIAFNVNEDWLRNGTGSMFIQPNTFSLDDYAKQRNLSDLDIEVIKNFMELDQDTRNSIYALFSNVAARKSIFDEVPNNPAELEIKYAVEDNKKLG